LRLAAVNAPRRFFLVDATCFSENILAVRKENRNFVENMTLKGGSKN
jgi:hypothetical protein